MTIENEKSELAVLENVTQEGGVEVKEFKGSSQLAEAIVKAPPKPWGRRNLQVLLFASLAFLCSTMNGYDGSLMSSILVLEPFRQEFGADVVGIKAAYISAMYQIGGVCAIPFVGPALDTYGRRMGMFIGCFIVVAGTVISSTSVYTSSLGHFLAGRFFLGFGVSIAASAAPSYVVEICHPACRGTITGAYNCCYYIGSITASGTTRGCADYPDNRSWIIPSWIQLVCSAIVCLGVYFIPESPRWLYTRGKKTQATDFLTKYHGEGDAENPFVTLQVKEFECQLVLDGSDKRFWDYRGLFRNRASIYRLGNNLVMSVWGQWTSGGLGYFVGGFYQTAGITNETTILNINLGTAFLNAVCAYSGALSVDRIGRRKLLLFTLSSLCVCWICVTIGTAQYASTGSAAAARAGIAFNIIFGAIYSFGITPMQALYPVEVLSYEMRAKGMAFSSLVVSAAGLVNQFGTPVALERIGWKLYIIFAVWVAIEVVVVYFFLVETKGFTLEELDEVFASKNPVKASLQKRRIAVDETKNVIEAVDV